MDHGALAAVYRLEGQVDRGGEAAVAGNSVKHFIFSWFGALDFEPGKVTADRAIKPGLTQRLHHPLGRARHPDGKIFAAPAAPAEQQHGQ